MKTIRAHHIQYDTDGHRIPGLKKELILEVDDDLNPEYDLANVISDKTGWCVVGFLWEEVKEPALANAGYTLIELLIVIFIVFMALVVLAALGFGGFAAWHFIGKYW